MDNKLFKISLKDYFEPATGAEQQKKYRLLIIDGHIFHVSNKFIKFIEANNIICICFWPNSIHLLQLLDVSVFGLLKQNCKKLLGKKTHLTTYHIDKVGFIPLIKRTKWQKIFFQIIQFTLQAIGLIPCNPASVFQKLSIRF